MEAKMVLLAVVVVIVAAAAIFTGIDLFLALSAEKTARGRKPEYFNSGYKPEHGTEFCRAHLVGRVSRLDDKALYLIEIHPENGATRSVFIEERKIL